MKMPTARKLPSGSWYVRVTVEGKTVNITKPTKREAEKAAAEIKIGGKAEQLNASLTVKQAAEKYIESRANVLSPSTTAGYKKIIAGRFQSAMTKPIDDITTEQWQKYVNAEAKLCGAKTLKNAWGFISSVIIERTGNRVAVRLPQVVAKEAAYISSDNLKSFLNELKGNRYEIAILLGLSGLRRSEILNVRWEDIDLDNNCIHVNGAAVIDENNQLVHKKENKNTTSRRTVPFILPQLREAIQKVEKRGEYVVDCWPNTINVVTQRVCEKAGIPKCTAHGLRKSFASIMLVDLRQPEQVVMAAGGWSDPGTMRKIYAQVSQQNLANSGEEYSNYFSKLL